MIEIQKGQKDIIRPFFADYQDTLVWSCLDDSMGRAFADSAEHPKYAKIVTACFAFLAGDATAPGASELIDYLPDDMENKFQLFVPENEVWTELVQKSYGDECIKKITRYAIKKEGDIFDRKKLHSFVDELDPQFEIKSIDGDLYDACLGIDEFHDFCGNFKSKEDFLAHGIGFVILKEGEIVSGASSYTYYKEGIEIEIDTKKEFRRMGLATVIGAKLILACLEENRYPSWDAANMESVHLAEKLGYHFDHEYDAYYAVFKKPEDEMEKAE